MKTLSILIVATIFLASCTNKPKSSVDEKVDFLNTHPFPNGNPIRIEFEKGNEYYHPLIVFWIEDIDGNYIETLYASQSIATGTFRFGVAEGGKWMPGERRRQAALPFWGHRRGEKAPDGLYLPSPQKPLPDAITGATPQGNFVINTKIDPNLKQFKIFMEINQTWDWNHHWHNNLHPDDEEYKTSCQPALVYMAEIDISSYKEQYVLKPVGHSHPSGKSGELFDDLSTFTTALEIAQNVTVKIGLLD